MSLLIPALLLILSIPLVLALIRANELFLLRVREGQVRVARGRIPPTLLDDLTDILHRGEVHAADVRAVHEGGQAKIYVFGAQPRGAVKQQLRNTMALWPVAKIRSAPKRGWFRS